MNPRVFWVELLDTSGGVLSRQRFEATDITIGRGYGNHVVIDDPHVAAVHLRVARNDDGVLFIEDLQTENGALEAGCRERFSRLALVEEAAIIIGQTHLRIRTSAFPVTPALAAPANLPPPALVGARAAPTATIPARHDAKLALLLIVAVMIWTALSAWLSQTGESKISLYMLVIVIPVLALGWAGLWALVNRIVAGQANFFRHLTIALTVLLLSEGIETLGYFLDYALAWTAIQKWLPLLLWGWLGATAITHLRIIAPRALRFAASLVGTLAVAAMAVQFLLRAEDEREFSKSVSTKLLPPFLILKSPVSTDAFFHSAQALKPDLDEARKKEPPGSDSD